MNIVSVDYILIPQLSAFASNVFIDYYISLIGFEQATYMADLFLSENAIKQLIDKGAIFRIIEDEKHNPLAFCEYIKEEDKTFLSKLYVKKEYRGQGLGKIMLDDCINYSRKHNSKAIYLTVNKHNTKSYETYLHWGFTVIDAVVNDIGNGYVMDDYIMQMDLL